jgi:hypothetical protein
MQPMRLPLSFLVSLPLALTIAACPSSEGETDEVGETDETDGTDGTDETADTTSESESTSEDTDTSETLESETGETDETGETGETEPELGATPNVQCEGALASFATVLAENQAEDPDPLAVEMAYVDTALQEFVQQAGAQLGRVDQGVLIDDAAILDALDSGTALDLIDVEWRIYLVMHLYVRGQTTSVSGTLPDPANDPALLYAKWDAAWCFWDGALRPLGQASDMLGPDDEASIETTIDEGFAWGHDYIQGPQPWAIDEWQVPAARQQIEKSLYTLFHRLVHGW